MVDRAANAMRRRFPEAFDPVERGAVDIWCFPLDPDLARPELLSADESARLRGMGSARRRQEFGVSRSVLRRILGASIGRPPESVPLRVGEHGKPAIDGVGPAFNLTHSGAIGALALVPSGRVGLDIEEVSRQRPFERLARRFFAEAEIAWLEAAGLLDDARAFYQLWTLKEAYLKALGTGLTLSSRRFTVDMSMQAPTLTPSDAAPESDAWRFEQPALAPGTVAAVCWDAPLDTVHVHPFGEIS